ncbi:MAG: ATP-binding protein [Coriobacteriia bacterium]|nr:ATP-binding protein [Coriobacteriia bacterium]
MEIRRDRYLDKLVKRQNNGMVKVITGVRRCGKSYLLFRLFKNHLIKEGVLPEHIIEIALDDISNKKLRNADLLYRQIKGRLAGHSIHYIFLDEIQFVDGFSDVVNGLLHIPNLDIYVTGSNSRLLSSDALTEFRGRGDEVRVYPLCFSEYASAYNGSTGHAWKDYYTFGGMPLVISREGDDMKADYLAHLFKEVYLRDIYERNRIRHEADLDTLVDILASSVGSLTNPPKLQRSFKSKRNSTITGKTIKTYINHLENAFLLESAQRYNVKGRNYIGSPHKYYFVDVGLRNARLGFRQQEENHIMENVIYNELRIRGYSVDVGVVDITETNAKGGRQQKRLEIDFIARRGSDQCYIQSAFAIGSHVKEAQEKRSLKKVPDSFRKYVIVKDDIKTKRDESGIVTMGLFDFLLNRDCLNL